MKIPVLPSALAALGDRVELERSRRDRRVIASHLWVASDRADRASLYRSKNRNRRSPGSSASSRLERRGARATVG